MMGRFGKAAMTLGSMGRKGKTAGGLSTLAESYQASQGGGRIMGRGRRRMAGIGAGAGLLTLNSMRSPGSSGSEGMMPQSSGGMTGAY